MNTYIIPQMKIKTKNYYWLILILKINEYSKYIDFYYYIFLNIYNI